MKHRLATLAVAGTLIGICLETADAALLTPTQRTCSRRIMHGARRYIYDVGLLLRDSIYFNTAPSNRFCATGRRCVGGTSHGSSCATNASCPGGNCYPNLFSGSGVSRRILQHQNQFKTYVYNNCTALGVTPADLLYPSEFCPDPAPGGPPMDFDQVADCILRNNASHREAGIIVDTTFEPYRRASTHLTVPHPADYISYPTTVCGVPGSHLLQYGSDGLESYAGRQGGTRLTFTDGCAGDVCQTKGEAVADFAGNLLDDPIQTYAGIIPICILMAPLDAGNGTFEAGSINLTTGDQSSFQRLEATVLIGTACPRCVTNTGLCDSGDRAGLPCLHRGAEDIACPPTIIGSPVVLTLPLTTTTSPVTLNVPVNNPAGGSSNPAGTFCGACDVDQSVGCQNDADCVNLGVCSGIVGSGCCTFGTNAGFALDPCPPPVTTITVEGARGPFVPHLATLFCLGKSGSALVDSTQGLPGPARFIEPRLNVYAW